MRRDQPVSIVRAGQREPAAFPGLDRRAEKKPSKHASRVEIGRENHPAGVRQDSFAVLSGMTVRNSKTTIRQSAVAVSAASHLLAQAEAQGGESGAEQSQCAGFRNGRGGRGLTH